MQTTDYNEMIETYSKIISIPAISPESGGVGESKRVDFLQGLLKSWGLSPKRYDYTDQKKVKRSNLVVKYGDKKKTLWILAHTDTVAVGDIKMWKTDPFKAVVKEGKIYGRGSQDNGQGIITGLYTLKALLGKKDKMKYNYGLVLAADEEVGSKYGIVKLLKENIFEKGDMFIVPDSGSADGKHIEIAEKSILWLKITVIGKQVHGSTPQKGINAFMEGARFGLDVTEFLSKKYNKIILPFGTKSSFVMTKHEKNVDSINIIPGKEVFYLDCRIMPNYSLTKVLEDINKMSKRYTAKIEIEIIQREDAPAPTRPNAEIVRLLKNRVKKDLGINAWLIGIGGGTIAAFLRRAGYDAVVWSIEEDIAHQPNEYAKLENVKKIIEIFYNIVIT